MPISTPSRLGVFTPILTSTATLESGSLSPAANALILVHISHRWSDGAGPGYISAVSSAFATGGWTIASGNSPTNNVEEFGSADIRSVWAWAITTASPGSGAVTVTLTNAHGQAKGFEILQIASGFNASAPITQTKVVGAASGTTLTGDFDAAPASSSMLLMGSVGGATSAADTTPASGWALTEAAGYLFNLRYATQYRTGTTATGFGITWASSSTLGIALNALEIAEEAAAGATLSTPTATSITQTTATIGCTSDTATGLVHAGVTTTATPPSDAQLIAGSGGGLIAAGSVSAAAGTNTVGLTGLTANTGYFRHFIQSDGAGTATSTMLSPDATAGFTTLEAIPAIDTQGYINATAEGFQLQFNTDTANGIAYYVVYETSFAFHTDDATGRAQVRDGQRSDGGAPSASGQMNISTTGQQTFPAVTGLNPGVYRYSIVHDGTP